MSAKTLPATQAFADQQRQAAEDAFWDHAEDCTRCLDSQDVRTAHSNPCTPGRGLHRDLNAAIDVADNWRTYNTWFTRGGLNRYLANDWIT